MMLAVKVVLVMMMMMMVTMMMVIMFAMKVVVVMVTMIMVMMMMMTLTQPCSDPGAVACGRCGTQLEVSPSGHKPGTAQLGTGPFRHRPR